jgi:uncharacterized membrane protein
MNPRLATLGVVVATLTLAACGTTTASRTGSGALGGAAAGAAVGSLSGNAGKGALIGAGVGAAGGLIYDAEKKKQEERDRYYRSY